MTIQTQINFSKTKPTARDLKIFEFMELGGEINNILALQMFQCFGLRDAIYRLRKAGYPVDSKTINYKTKEGRTKRYESYFIKTA